MYNPPLPVVPLPTAIRPYCQLPKVLTVHWTYPTASSVASSTGIDLFRPPPIKTSYPLDDALGFQASLEGVIVLGFGRIKEGGGGVS